MADLSSAYYLQIQLVKRAVGNPALEWRNTYEAELAVAGASESAFATMLETLAQAEKALHSPSVEYVRGVVSTYAQEGHGSYDPQSFIVKEYAAGAIIGTRAITGDALGAQVVLSARRQVSTGRSGRLYYRGCLAEGDTIAGTSLSWALTSGAKSALDTLLSGFRTAFDNAMIALGGADSGMRLLHGYNIVTQQPLDVRNVTALDARGVATRKLNNAYFDVSP